MLSIPSAAAWRGEVPAWAAERRDEIISRVRAEGVPRGVELVETNSFQNE
jgi:hypothetical protein